MTFTLFINKDILFEFAVQTACSNCPSVKWLIYNLPNFFSNTQRCLLAWLARCFLRPNPFRVAHQSPRQTQGVIIVPSRLLCALRRSIDVYELDNNRCGSDTRKAPRWVECDCAVTVDGWMVIIVGDCAHHRDYPKSCIVWKQPPPPPPITLKPPTSVWRRHQFRWRYGGVVNNCGDHENMPDDIWGKYVPSLCRVYCVLCVFRWKAASSSS